MMPVKIKIKASTGNEWFSNGYNVAINALE